MSHPAALLAVDPVGLGGAVLRGPPGPARDGWLDELRAMLPPGAPFRRVPLHVGADRLLGGLDLAATLAAGRPLVQRGLLAEADGGAVVLPSAERIEPGLAGRIAAVLDQSEVVTERDGVSARNPARIAAVALDESEEGEATVSAALGDRLAFHLDPRSDFEPGPFDIAAARALLPAVTTEDAALDALCTAAFGLGIDSLRAPLLALHAARAAAALAGRLAVAPEDVALAAQLVLAPRATRVPAPPPPPPEPVPEEAQEPASGQALEDRVLEAALAALPPGLLAQLAAGAGPRGGKAGRSGRPARAGARGRPGPSRAGDPRTGLRLDVVETLRAAVPWQRLRRPPLPPGEGRGEGGPDHCEGGPDVRALTLPSPGGRGFRLAFRASDLRVIQRKPQTKTTTIFLVDASGSQALNRLAEAKGAVQLLLAECYVRRDEVALIAFRGRAAELLLPPTRSLVRAKRSLAGLPGGGGTPLAAGLDAGCALADAVRRRGGTASLVLLTDGQANVGLDGRGGRAGAERDAIAAAGRIRAAGHAVMLVDSAVRPVPASRRLASAMGARYVPLPFAGAAALSQLVRPGA